MGRPGDRGTRAAARGVVGTLAALLMAACVGEAVSVPPAVPASPPRACAARVDGRTTLQTPDGICIPSDDAAIYRCASDRAPAIVRFRGTRRERRYLGGSYAVPVPALPAPAGVLGSAGATTVYVRRGHPDWLWTRDEAGLHRWLLLPRRPPWRPLGPSANASAAASGSGSGSPSAPSASPPLDAPFAAFIGDSITDGAAPFIARGLGGWHTTFDAVIGRASSSGVAPAQVLASGSPPPDAVLVELGTNDQDPSAFRANAHAIVRALANVPLLVWQTVHGPLSTRAPVNATIHRLVAEDPTATIADWHAFAHNDELGSDHIHPQLGHEDLMAQLVVPLLEGWREAAEGHGATACV